MNVGPCCGSYSLRYMGILAAFTAMLPAVYHGSRDHHHPPPPPHPPLRPRALPSPELHPTPYACPHAPRLPPRTTLDPTHHAASGTTTRATTDPTEYFLTCLHLLVNVGMACKDLVLSSKVLSSCQPPPPAAASCPPP